MDDLGEVNQIPRRLGQFFEEISVFIALQIYTDYNNNNEK